uniref:Uncharacterized protein n=1 Tax=viral metagenome TaxID=1070528 RepID=A0A6C0LD55_9ZZZZ
MVATLMVATLIEAFGNNFNDDNKCDNCDSRTYRVTSCSNLNHNQSLCENALAQNQTFGTSQNCEYSKNFCTTPDTCMLGDPNSIDSNCKLQPKGNLSKPICTGVKLKTSEDYCLEPPLKQRYIRSINPIQNYYCDENYQNCKFCKWIDQDNQSTTQIDCEPK